DTREQATKLAEKIWRLRIFRPDRYPELTCAPPSGSSEVSAADLELPVLVVSQFTLYGRTDKGRRPTWEDAAGGEEAEPLIDEFVAALRGVGATVSTGAFGADMRVSLTNDGPITLIVEV
ncbi:MAG: D-aminoacyl-tRNA deacylase, partial [Actinomycetia bacterium]|nr:D-aminoacyl-tRNA deacylase [Actinomycetes bacterium]